MSKINQIQSTLREMEGGAFQKLCGAYLHKKGYDNINPIGSVIGSDKVRKGTPDTLISLKNGKYVFAEYTTQQTGLFNKIEEDIKKCLDEDKTGIKVKLISEIVYCHLTNLSPDEQEKLAGICRVAGVNLSMFGIGPISYDLYQKYPNLAKEFLSVEIDTGQVLQPDDFINTYNKNSLTTPLNTSFRFRADELSNSIKYISENDLVLISGRAGVGKTRLALECCDQFKQANNEYDVFCLINKGQDLFEDIKSYFSKDGKFLILVDDANRITRFDYIIQLLQEQRDDQRIKIIATVRDYALEKVLNIADPLGKFNTIELQPLKNEEIQELVENECNVNHPLFLERIVKISGGNPRLAMMAGRIAKEQQTFDSISDVTQLYNEYYKGIKNEIQDLGDNDIITASGIISFFQVVDKSNENLMEIINNVFGMSAKKFWTSAKLLHQLEVVDMYENEIVRVSDQVLGTYLFYLALFENKTIGFDSIITELFPKYRVKIIDSLYPIINSFGHDEIIKQMKPTIDLTWEQYENNGDTDGLLHIMEVFWFMKQTDVLLYIKNAIASMDREIIPEEELKFEKSASPESPSIPSLLEKYHVSNEGNIKNAISLMIDYLRKKPSHLGNVIYVLLEAYGFEHRSCYQKYLVQYIVINTLWKATIEHDDVLLKKLFLFIGLRYLNTYFTRMEAAGKLQFTMIQFSTSLTDELKAIRKIIWDGVINLANDSDLQPDALKFIDKYTQKRGHDINDSKALEYDSQFIIPFIVKQFDTSDYDQCKIAYAYFEMLDEYEIEYDIANKELFNNEEMELTSILSGRRAERKYLHLDYKEYEAHKQKMIKDYFKDYNLQHFKDLFQICMQIASSIDEGHLEWEMKNNINQVLIDLAERDSALYVDVIKHYLEIGSPLGLWIYSLAERLVGIVGAKSAYELLTNNDKNHRYEWLFCYFAVITEADITADMPKDILSLYEKAGSHEILNMTDYYLKYLRFDGKLIINITRVLINKAKEDENLGYCMHNIINPHTETNKQLMKIFEDDIDLLLELYLLLAGQRDHLDYHGETLNRILDIRPEFIVTLIKHYYAMDDHLSRYSDKHDYTFIWLRPDYYDVMERIANCILQEQDGRYNFDSYLLVFFDTTRSKSGKDETIAKQDDFLKRQIEQRYNDLNYMKFLFKELSVLPFGTKI